MTAYPQLQDLLARIEEAESRYETKTAKTYNEAVIAAAVAEYNAVLEQAAQALIEDLGTPSDADKILTHWRPETPTDTWFGPDPGDYLRDILRTGVIHRGELPDQTQNR